MPARNRNLQPLHYSIQLDYSSQLDYSIQPDYSTQLDYLTQPGICLRLRFLAKEGESGQGETGGVEVLEV
jgi:hypothetical protein